MLRKINDVILVLTVLVFGASAPTQHVEKYYATRWPPVRRGLVMGRSPMRSDAPTSFLVFLPEKVVHIKVRMNI